MCVAILVFPRFNLYKRKSAGKRDKAACLRPTSGLPWLNLYCYRCVARSGDAARKCACATRVARTLVFAAFALLRTLWDFDTKVLVPTAH